MKSGNDFDTSELILTSGEFSSDCSHFDLIEIFEQEVFGDKDYAEHLDKTKYKDE